MSYGRSYTVAGRLDVKTGCETYITITTSDVATMSYGRSYSIAGRLDVKTGCAEMLLVIDLLKF
jgi:hypothetical protein